ITRTRARRVTRRWGSSWIWGCSIPVERNALPRNPHRRDRARRRLVRAGDTAGDSRRLIPMSNSAQAKSRFEAVTPRLPVRDVEKVLAFYIEQLGFQMAW